MFGGSIFKQVEKDRFLVTNTGEGKDINNMIVKVLVKDLKYVLASYGIETKKKKKQELIDDFIKLSMNEPIVESKVKTEPKVKTKSKVKPKVKTEPKFEPLEEKEPKPKNIQIKKPKPKDEPKIEPVDMERVKALEKATDPSRLDRLLPIRSEREDDLLELEDDELKEIIDDQEIKFKSGNKRDMVDAILKHEGIVKGSVLPKEKYDQLQEIHNVLQLENGKGDKGLAVMYRILEKFKEDLKKMRSKSERDTSAEFFKDLRIKRHIERTQYVEDLLLKDESIFNKKAKASKKVSGEKRKGGAISDAELGKFVEASYKKKGEVQNIDGYKIDNDLSTRRNKVYTNDKGEAVVAIAGTDNAKDWSNNLLIPFGLHSQTNRYKNSEETLKKVNEKYNKNKVSVVGHSQSGHIVNDLANKGLIGSEAIAYNPAIIGKTNKNVKVVKSELDPVSLFTKTKKGDTVIKPTTYNPFKYNPFTAHSTKPLK